MALGAGGAGELADLVVSTQAAGCASVETALIEGLINDLSCVSVQIREEAAAMPNVGLPGQPRSLIRRVAAAPAVRGQQRSARARTAHFHREG